MTRLVVAGGRPDQALQRRCNAPGVSLIAEPCSLAPLYREASAAIVPLRTGSGSRIKILEAGASGVPVISTHEGASGLALDAERHFFASAADPAAFADACVKCLGDREVAMARAGRLFDFVCKNHDRTHIIADLAELMSRTFGL